MSRELNELIMDYHSREFGLGKGEWGMFEKRNRRLKLLVSLSVLFLTILACGGPKTGCEYWFGGEWVVDPQYPEEGCCKVTTNKEFEGKCEDKGATSSQFPDPESESDPVTELESELPGDVNLSDLAGTYVGTTNFLDFHIEDWGGGAITQNDITITISEDGTVDGIFIVIFESSQKSNESCVWHVLRTQSGTIFGQISQSIGTIKFDYTSKQELFRNCLGGNATTVNDHQDEFHIDISGNTMTGSGDGSKTFEATRQ